MTFCFRIVFFVLDTFLLVFSCFKVRYKMTKEMLKVMKNLKEGFQSVYKVQEIHKRPDSKPY